MHMQKLLVIVGPTATGKTALSIQLAKQFGGEIISADSRQLYEGMDIGTGKRFSDEVDIWGYDLAKPTEEFSVSHYQTFAREKIDEIASRKKLPLLVGGTGLYIRAAVDGIETANVPQDAALRERLDGCSVSQLILELENADPEKLARMNESDRNNPRRLIRAIEIARSTVLPIKEKSLYDTLFIGLTAPLEVLYKRVEDNIAERIASGVFEEVEKLLSSGVSFENQSMTSLGYRQLKDYFEGRSTKNEAIAEWILQEKKYVKRQITWFKQDSRVNWVSIVEPNMEQKVEQYIKTWENKQS